MRIEMPDHMYRGRMPPTGLDRILAHPWELSISIWSALIGAGTILTTALNTSTTASSSVSELPGILIYALASMLVVGGAQVVWGLFSRHPDLMVGFSRERVGLVLIGTAWLVYAVAVLAAFPDAISSWTSGLTLFIAATLRLIATLRDEGALRRWT